MNCGMEGLMTIQGTRVVHGTPEPHFSLNNTTTSSASQVNADNDMMSPPVGGNMEVAENVSSLARISTMLLEDGSNATEENLNFEEQFRELDKEINYYPGSSKLNLDFPGLPSVAVPMFSHATSSVNVSKPNSDFIGNEVGREMDSLETTRADEFKVGWTFINKEKKGTRGRPKKFVHEVLFNDAALTLSSPNKFALPTRNSKRTWKRVVDKTLNSSAMKDGSPDLGEKRKVVETESEEDYSITKEKKQKIEEVVHLPSSVARERSDRTPATTFSLPESPLIQF
nr:hypothetical protein CFP56_65338 [Quercus suber]